MLVSTICPICRHSFLEVGAVIGFLDGREIMVCSKECKQESIKVSFFVNEIELLKKRLGNNIKIRKRLRIGEPIKHKRKRDYNTSSYQIEEKLTRFILKRAA